MIDDRAKEITEKAEALKNPQTLEDYRNLVRSKWRMAVHVKSFLSLTPEQQIKYDELEAESTKKHEKPRNAPYNQPLILLLRQQLEQLSKPKHTRDGYDLFVVQLSDRLSTDDYKQVLSGLSV